MYHHTGGGKDTVRCCCGMQPVSDKRMLQSTPQRCRLEESRGPPTAHSKALLYTPLEVVESQCLGHRRRPAQRRDETIGLKSVRNLASTSHTNKQMTPYVRTQHTQHKHHEDISSQEWEKRQAPSTGRCCVALYLAGTDLCTRSLRRLVFVLTLGGLGSRKREGKGMNRSAGTIHVESMPRIKKNEHRFVRNYKDQFDIIINIKLF